MQKCLQLLLGKNSTLQLTVPCQIKDKIRVQRNVSRSLNEMAEVAEKIILSLTTALDKDDLIDEFDIIPEDTQSNRSPVIHIDHKLGLESWCVGFVYSHLFQKFILLRPGNKTSVHRSTSISFGSNATDGDTNRCIHGKGECTELTDSEKQIKCQEFSRLLVLINPDLTVAWNFRRESVLKGTLRLQDELHLVNLVASRKPKCPEGFSYKRWLVKQFLKNEAITGAEFLSFFDNEAKAALRTASKYFSNYHAWDYRVFLLQTWMERKDVPVEVKKEILNSEKQVSDDWLYAHISDYCGFHYRQKLFNYLVSFQASDAEAIKLLELELPENAGMILYYRGHESPWYHRRFLIKRYSEIYPHFRIDIDMNEKLTQKEINLVDNFNFGSEKAEHENGEVNLASGPNVTNLTREVDILGHLYSERYLKWFSSWHD